MAIHKAIDSDVDRITQFALRGVSSFIAMYQDDEPATPARTAAGPAQRVAARPAAPTPARKTTRKATRR